MDEQDPRQVPRSVRVTFPARVEFAGERFQIDEFTADLSDSGIFLPTDTEVASGTRGTLTFRITQWDRPFTVEAEVVRVGTEGEGTDQSKTGLGIRFINLEDVDRKRLQRLVDGVKDGSVIQSIRRSIRESGKGLDHELRIRPMDQKLILASFASGEEIEALIRDGQKLVLQRLLKNPRLRIHHVRGILKSYHLTQPMLLEIKRHREWMRDDESRYLFCKHHNAPLQEVLSMLPTLPLRLIQQLSGDGMLRSPVQQKVKDILKKKPGHSR